MTLRLINRMQDIPMSIELKKEEVDQILPSIRRYIQEELDLEISEMKSKFLLNYFLKEIAPLAYNKGVQDAERFFRDKIEDLSGSCYEQELTYWKKNKA